MGKKRTIVSSIRALSLDQSNLSIMDLFPMCATVVFNTKQLKMASGGTIHRSLLFVCVKNDNSKDRNISKKG